jgi:hypothetical protein
MDFLNSQSDSLSQMSNCFGLDEITSQDDYLMSDSNIQNTQSMKSVFTLSGNLNSTIHHPNYNLEVINEESNFSPNESQLIQNNNINNNIKPPFQNQNSIIEKGFKLSQQIDNLDNDTKNSQNNSVKSNNNNNERNNIQNKVLQKLPEQLSNMSQEFISKLDIFVNNGLNILENSKKEYINLIDNYKNNFRKNANFLKNLLVINTENIIKEEEKNKIIDQRMNQLFNELINLMNDIQGFALKK